jgi:hypothetical protein
LIHAFIGAVRADFRRGLPLCHQFQDGLNLLETLHDFPVHALFSLPHRFRIKKAAGIAPGGSSTLVSVQL